LFMFRLMIGLSKSRWHYNFVEAMKYNICQYCGGLPSLWQFYCQSKHAQLRSAEVSYISNLDPRQQLCLLPSMLLCIIPWIHSSFTQPLYCIASIIQCSTNNKFFFEGENEIQSRTLHFKILNALLSRLYFLFCFLGTCRVIII
jgi:hypothetical protein